jgi:hypothetical protein
LELFGVLADQNLPVTHISSASARRSRSCVSSGVVLDKSQRFQDARLGCPDPHERAVVLAPIKDKLSVALMRHP